MFMIKINVNIITNYITELLHVYLLAECLRILLHLFQDHAHGRVTHNLLHLGVGHSPPFHVFRAIVPHSVACHAALDALRGFLNGGGR